MRAFVCGGQEFADRDWLFASLDDMHARETIAAIHRAI
jgi:hypothetical protein